MKLLRETKFSLPVWINGSPINGLWIGSALGIGCYGPKPEHAV